MKRFNHIRKLLSNIYSIHSPRTECPPTSEFSEVLSLCLIKSGSSLRRMLFVLQLRSKTRFRLAAPVKFKWKPRWKLKIKFCIKISLFQLNKIQTKYIFLLYFFSLSKQYWKSNEVSSNPMFISNDIISLLQIK